MPTGYTCDVQNGKVTELKDYLLDCSRSFGALIHMRDERMDTPIKLREVSDYHLESLNKAKKDYDEFLLKSDEEIQKMLDDSYERSLKEKEEGLKRFDQQRKRYGDMLAKVESWEIPTEEHKNLKKFAIQQLKDSIDFDCSDSHRDYYLTEPHKDTVEVYKTWKLDRLLKDIEYHSKEYKEECKRVKEANQWITDLYDSFN
jgi:hypothetical protein